MTITNAWREVEDVLLGAEPNYDDTEVAEIDRTTADRYLRRVARLDAEHAAKREMVEAQVEELQRWLAREYEGYMVQRGWLSERLHRFHDALHAMDPRVKTVKLPAGELRLRGQQPTWTFDTETFLPWARKHAPELVREVPATDALDVNAAKAYLTRKDDKDEVTARGFAPDGVQPPGVTVVDVDDKFSLVPNVDHDAPAE